MSYTIPPSYLKIILGVVFGISASAFVTVKAARAFTLIAGYKHVKIDPIAWRDYLARPESFDAFNSAKNDWDATSTKVGFLYNSANPTLTIREVNLSAAYNGFTLTNGATGKADVNLNWFYLQSDTVNARRGTAGHELGHALSLNDNNSGGAIIMNVGRNRNQVFTPQTDDVNGVNSVYGYP